MKQLFKVNRLARKRTRNFRRDLTECRLTDNLFDAHSDHLFGLEIETAGVGRIYVVVALIRSDLCNHYGEGIEQMVHLG